MTAIIKLNRSEVSVDVKPHYLLSPSDPRCSVPLALVAVYSSCIGGATWAELGHALASTVYAFCPCPYFRWDRIAYMTLTGISCMAILIIRPACSSCLVRIAWCCSFVLKVFVMRATFIESLHADCKWWAARLHALPSERTSCKHRISVCSSRFAICPMIVLMKA